jgi:hypothetical protein
MPRIDGSSTDRGGVARVVAPPLPPELADLIERVARHPHGLGFLHQAYLESVAVTLGVHPFVVDAARAYLETAEGRASLIAEVRRAHERQAAVGPPPPAGRAAPCACHEAGGLIGAAQANPRGARLLVDAPPAEIARAFGVHPYVVVRARGILERQGMAPRADRAERADREESLG